MSRSRVIPEGETWRIRGLVEFTEPIIVKGTLVMRAGDTLRADKGIIVREGGKLDLGAHQ